MPDYGDKGASFVWSEAYFKPLPKQERNAPRPVEPTDTEHSGSPETSDQLTKEISDSLQRLLWKQQAYISDRTICADLAEIARLVEPPPESRQSEAERGEAILSVGQTNPFAIVRIAVLNSLTNTEFRSFTIHNHSALNFIKNSFFYDEPKLQRAAITALESLQETAGAPCSAFIRELEILHLDDKAPLNADVRERIAAVVEAFSAPH